MVKKSNNKKEPEETYTSADLKRYIGALMEENREQIKGIAERFVDFDRKLDSHTAILETHGHWFENIDLKLISHTQMIGELAENVATLTGNVATLTGNVATLTKDVSIIKEKVSSIEDTLKTKVDREEFVILDRRVTSVEAKV